MLIFILKYDVVFLSNAAESAPTPQPIQNATSTGEKEKEEKEKKIILLGIQVKEAIQQLHNLKDNSSFYDPNSPEDQEEEKVLRCTIDGLVNDYIKTAASYQDGYRIFNDN